MNNKKRLLVAGGGYADIPMIKAAQVLGFHVITSGNRPDDLGHRFADQYCLADFSDSQAMLSLSRELGIDAICASCNDFSALTCAYVANELGLPGHDNLIVSEIIHHKDQWRAFAQFHDIPSPRAIGCSNMVDVMGAISQLRLPLIVKPIDLTGGKGVRRTDTAEETVLAAQAAFDISRAKRIVVEEFITGSRHGFTAILRSGRVAFHFLDDENYHLSQYLVSGASAPTSCLHSSVLKLIELSERIANLLQLVDGIFHVQFIEQPDGVPVIIEICRRPPGDLYVELVRHATGAPYSEWIVRAAAGLDLQDICSLPVNRCVTRHCLMADKAGIFTGFDFDPVTEAHIIDRFVWARPGDIVLDELSHKFGIVFVEHRDVDQMRSVVPKLQRLLSSQV